jgi:hypothetical protein
MIAQMARLLPIDVYRDSLDDFPRDLVATRSYRRVGAARKPLDFQSCVLL